jgi:hypothetical protein
MRCLHSLFLVPLCDFAICFVYDVSIVQSVRFFSALKGNHAAVVLV